MRDLGGVGGLRNHPASSPTESPCPLRRNWPMVLRHPTPQT
ncbi:hypothetical protein [Lysobacter gummosus]